MLLAMSNGEKEKHQAWGWRISVCSLELLLLRESDLLLCPVAVKRSRTGLICIGRSKLDEYGITFSIIF